MRDILIFLIFGGFVLLSIFGEDVIFYLLKILGGTGMAPSIIVLAVLIIIFLASAIKILPEYERGVIFRLGRVIGAKGPGIIILIPFIDKMVRVSLRVITMDVPTQDVITKDNVSVKVDAVVYFRVIDPVKAIVNVEDFMYATSQISQTTLRSVCGQAELDELLSQREKLNLKLQEIIDKETDAWGVKVVSVELKRIDLPEELVKAMARQAEAERERRAKIISAEAEYQAAQKLVEAAQLLAQQPIAMQLRYLETLNTIGQKNAKTIVFPFPTELMSFLEELKKNRA
ncbi:slipin family protein [Persephonella atlantica]|uniref:Slipin family protein n=1 Tax=Persephonella atlantica TaxID=2699429 RepID=A0ABS1GIC2_9AQUI|nr:slipin family protein [Persephonella atlantica]MBK3332586.1 slipin family protein [Persephonella atlantica]